MKIVKIYLLRIEGRDGDDEEGETEKRRQQCKVVLGELSYGEDGEEEERKSAGSDKSSGTRPAGKYQGARVSSRYRSSFAGGSEPAGA